MGVDAITVATRLRESGAWSEQLAKHLAEIEGGQSMLIERHVVDHARIVARKARMRRVISTLQEWTARGYDDVPDELLPIRTVKEAKVPEMGPVVWPAYTETSVSMRSQVIDLGRLHEPEQRKLLATAVFLAEIGRASCRERVSSPV